MWSNREASPRRVLGLRQIFLAAAIYRNLVQFTSVIREPHSRAPWQAGIFAPISDLKP
jgi:hypothetical protein